MSLGLLPRQVRLGRTDGRSSQVPSAKLQCAWDELIVVAHARYGRMRINQCVLENFDCRRPAAGTRDHGATSLPPAVGGLATGTRDHGAASLPPAVDVLAAGTRDHGSAVTAAGGRRTGGRDEGPRRHCRRRSTDWWRGRWTTARRHCRRRSTDWWRARGTTARRHCRRRSADWRRARGTQGRSRLLKSGPAM